MRYLVGTDGSEESDDAVRYAARHALAFDATLEIVHVLQPEAEMRGDEIVLPAGDEAVEQGNRVLDQAQRLAAQAVDDSEGEISIQTELLTGQPVAAMTEHARKTDADAIYVGHRGLSEKREEVVGSVAKSIIDKTTVPVTIIR